MPATLVTQANYNGQSFAFEIVKYNNQIFGGTYNAANLFKWNGSDAWGLGGDAPGNDIYCLAEYNGKLYAGASGRLYEWDGISTLVSVASLLVANATYDLIVFNGSLYAAMGNYGGTGSGYLYRWNNVDSWEVVSQAVTRLRTLAIYNSKIYAGTYGLGKLYEWNGVDTLIQKASQFGSEDTINGLVVHNSRLYAGSFPGGRLLRWNDVGAWEQVAGQIASESGIHGFWSAGGTLYAGTFPGGKICTWDGVSAWNLLYEMPAGVTGVMGFVQLGTKVYACTSGDAALYELSTIVPPKRRPKLIGII